MSSEISTPFQPYTSSNRIISSTPFEVKFNVVKSINNLELFAGTFYRNNSQYLPNSYFGFNYRNKKKLNYGSNLSYGVIILIIKLAVFRICLFVLIPNEDSISKDILWK